MSTKKLFALRISTIAMIWATDDVEAQQVADEEANDIVRNVSSLDYEVLAEDVKAADLPKFAWDEDCIPYGHDGNTCIKELLTP